LLRKLLQTPPAPPSFFLESLRPTGFPALACARAFAGNRLPTTATSGSPLRHHQHILSLYINDLVD